MDHTALASYKDASGSYRNHRSQWKFVLFGVGPGVLLPSLKPDFYIGCSLKLNTGGNLDDSQCFPLAQSTELPVLRMRHLLSFRSPGANCLGQGITV